MDKTRFLVQAAAIAAIYVVLTLIFAPISFGETLIEFRIAEALTVLPLYTPAAIPGLFVGCLISNLFSPVGTLDIVLGSLATLLAAYLTYRSGSKLLAPLPPVVVNALIIGGMLHYVYKFPLYLSVLSVGAGQLAVCYGLGLLLLFVLDKYKKYLFAGE
ncbi:MAG TPA: QueT transporter family protein [Candidatus Atribacteria bacterium]|nr:QueT transporter family protein [Candidatus Atribacteria bacterium]